jgi:hypothetical protein
VAELEEFLEWHRRIVTWGLGVYVVSYVRDLEIAMGAPRRESLLRLIMTEKEVTAPVQSMDLGESARREEIEQVETEQEETEQATEQEETEQEAEQATEQADTDQVDKRPLSLHPTCSGIPSAPVGGSRAHGTFHNRFHYMLCLMSSRG